MAEHDQMSSHQHCMRLSERGASDERTGLLQGLSRHIPVTFAREVVCRLIETVFTVFQLNIAFACTVDLYAIQTAVGLRMGPGIYQSNVLWDDIIIILAAHYRARLALKILRSLGEVGLSLIGDESDE